MTLTINQVSIAVRVLQPSAGAMQTIEESVYTAAEEHEEREKDRRPLFSLLNSNILFKRKAFQRIIGDIILIIDEKSPKVTMN